MLLQPHFTDIVTEKRGHENHDLVFYRIDLRAQTAAALKGDGFTGNIRSIVRS